MGLFEIRCDDCAGSLMIDMKETMDAYYKDMDYLVNEVNHIVEATLQNYLIYRCTTCDKTFKFTYADWEKRMRELIAMEVMEVRKHKMFKDLNPQSVNPDSGLEYCGQCSGYAGDGNCLVDIINQCVIRKK